MSAVQISIVVSLAVSLVVLLIVARLSRRLLAGGANATPDALAPGTRFTDTALVDDNGQPVSGAAGGKPRVLVFLRGGWCPFCTSQVESLTEHYRQISELGAELVFVTPRPLDTTRRVAEVFGVDFTFWIDEDLAVARELGIYHPNAVPERFRDKYGPDAFRPASVIVDTDGIIRYSRVAPDVSTRPDPAELVRALQQLQ